MLALKETKYKSCPSEDVCMSDPEIGKIAQMREAGSEVTVESFCNSRNCELYDTKPENIPEELREPLKVGQELRELAKLGLIKDVEDLTVFEVMSLLAVERGFNQADLEEFSKDQEEKGYVNG